MPLIEKEIIGPGTYFYTDEKTNEPRKLVVTPELTKYWQDQGKAMLDAGLTVPVPYEHDFNAHPMTPKDKLLNNAGWVSDYKLRDDKLFGVVDVQDENVAKKLPNTIRWTSPWINSFVDGNGKQWKNVISHLALTLRPRITKQEPFPSIAAALSLADTTYQPSENGFLLSRAGRVIQRKSDKKLFPMYPMAFSLYSGVALSDDDMPAPKSKKDKKPSSLGGKPDSNPTPGETSKGNETDTSDDKTSQFEEPNSPGKPGESPTGEPSDKNAVDLPPLGDKAGDVTMEEVLCDLLRALGVDCEHNGDEAQFKRNLYMAAMQKVHELTNKGMNKDQEIKPGEVNKGNPPGANPLVQQEQQPMYMSLEDINKISDPNLKGVALSMYTQNEVNKKKIENLEKSKIDDSNKVREQRIAKLSRVSPNVKVDLEKMKAMPNMALSIGEDGSVIDPMEPTLAMLEKGFGNLPQLLTTPSIAMSEHAHPTDEDMLSEEAADKLADDMARRMGASPEKKAS